MEEFGLTFGLLQMSHAAPSVASASIGMEDLFCLFSSLCLYVYTNFTDCMLIISYKLSKISALGNMRKMWSLVCGTVALALDNDFTNFKQYYILS